MAGLDYLFNGSPQSLTGTAATTADMPEWYSELARGIANKGVQVAGEDYQAYPGQRLAGFTPDQLAAFQNTEDMQGAWQNNMMAANDAAGQTLPTAAAFLDAGAQYGDKSVNQASEGADLANYYAGDQSGVNYATGAGNSAMSYAGDPSGVNYAMGAGDNANAAVSGNAADWTNNYKQYMSPYTSSVVDEIGRLGNQNLNENIMPGINNSFIGNGGFGSTRNADILAKGVRDAQTNISGLQAKALESGYQTSADIFGQDATRQQNQQQMQGTTALNAGTLGSNAFNAYNTLGANTAIGAGSLGSKAMNDAASLGANTAVSAGGLSSNASLQAGQLANAGGQIGSAAADTAAQRYGALGQLGQNMGYQDAAALGATGTAQQQLEQTGYDTSYDDFLTQGNYDWSNLNNINSLLRGMQIPTGSTTTQSTPTGSTSPLSWVNALSGISQASAPAGG